MFLCPNNNIDRNLAGEKTTKAALKLNTSDSKFDPFHDPPPGESASRRHYRRGWWSVNQWIAAILIMFISDLRRDFFDRLRHERVLVLANLDVDAVCSVKILQYLFKAEQILHTLVPVQGRSDLIRAFQANVQPQEIGPQETRYVVLINCGATVDLAQDLGLLNDNDEDDGHAKGNQSGWEGVVIFVADSHRPVDVTNVYNDGQIKLLMPQDPEEGIPSFEQVFRDEDEDEVEDNEEEDEFGEKRSRFDEAAILKRRDRRIWEERRAKILFDYQQFSYYAQPTALLMFDLAWKMSRDSNDLLWWAIIGLTEQSILMKSESDQYLIQMGQVRDHVTRLNNRLDADTLAVNCLKVAFDKELNLVLYRHWTIYESLIHSLYTAAKFKIWTLKGKQRLSEFLAELGLPLVQCKQSFATMDLSLRNDIVSMFEKMAEKYKLDQITSGTFHASFGFRNKFNAQDVVYAVLALMEHVEPETPAADAFLQALDCLSRSQIATLETGITSARGLITVVMEQVQNFLDLRLIVSAGPFLYAVIQDGTPNAFFFSRPSALLLLAHYTLRAHVTVTSSKKASSLPLVISTPLDSSEGVCLVAGVPPGRSEREKAAQERHHVDPFVANPVLINAHPSLAARSTSLVSMSTNALDESGPASSSSSRAATSMSCQWQETEDADQFEELQRAIADGQTQKFPGPASRSGYEGSGSSQQEEQQDEREPPEDQPGLRLLWAAQHGHMDVLKAVLDIDPKLIKFQDDDGYSALHRAGYSNRKDIAQELLFRGADLGSLTHDRWTPLLSAARWNAWECVELLLQWGANVNHVSESGQTALHLATFQGQSKETLHLLLGQAHLEASTRNCQGDLAVDIAWRNNCYPHMAATTFDSVGNHVMSEEKIMRDTINAIHKASTNGDERTRDPAVQSLKVIAIDQSLLVLQTWLDQFARTNGGSSPSEYAAAERVYLLQSLEQIVGHLVAQKVALDEDLAHRACVGRIIALTTEEMTRQSEVIPDVQKPCSNVLVKLGEHYMERVMDALLIKFQPGANIHFYVILSMSALAQANSMDIVPFLKAILGTVVANSKTVKKENIKYAYAILMARSSEAILDYLANINNAPDPSVTKEHFEKEIDLIHELFFNVWLNTRDLKVKHSVLEALAHSAKLLSSDRIAKVAASSLSTLISAYKRTPEHYYVTLSITQLVDASVKVDGALLEPVMESLLTALFNQIFSQSAADYGKPLTMKNHHEVLRCYDILVRTHNSKLVAGLVVRSGSVDENVRLAALTVFKHILTSSLLELEDKIGDIFQALHGKLNDQSNKIRKIMAQLTAQLGRLGYLKEPEGKDFLEFVVRICALPPDDPETKAALHKGDVSCDELREICGNILQLWSTKESAMDKFAPNINRHIPSLWKQRISLLQHYLEKHVSSTSSTWDQNQWEEWLLTLLDDTIGEIGLEEWTSALALSINQQLALYKHDDEVKERCFLMKSFGLVLKRTSGKQLILEHLSTLFLSTNQAQHEQQMACARAFGSCASRHLPLVLDKLESLLKSGSQKRSGSFFGFLRDSKTEECQIRARCTILLCVGQSAVMSSNLPELAKKVDEITQKFIMPALKSANVVLRVSALSAMADIARALQKYRNEKDAPELLPAHHGDLLHEAIECLNDSTWSISDKLEALSTIFELIQIPPFISQMIRCSLLKACFTAVFPGLVQQYYSKEENYSDVIRREVLFKQVVDKLLSVVQELLRQELEQSTLDEIFTLLEPWLQKDSSLAKEMAIIVLEKSLRTFLELVQFKVGSPSSFAPGPYIVGSIVPRCFDASLGVQRVSLECIQLLIKILATFDGHAKENIESMLTKLKALCVLSPMAEREPLNGEVVSRPLSQVLCERIQHSHLLPLIHSLVESLTDDSPNSALGTSIILGRLIESRGNELYEQAPDLVQEIQSKLKLHEGCAETRIRMLTSIRLLAALNSRCVVERLLINGPLPIDDSLDSIWKVLSHDSSLAQSALKQLLQQINSKVDIYSEQKIDHLSSRPVRCAHHLPLASISALNSLFQMKEMELLCESEFPVIFVSLISTLSCYVGVQSVEKPNASSSTTSSLRSSTHSKSMKTSSSPSGLLVSQEQAKLERIDPFEKAKSALQAFLECKGHESAVMIVQNFYQRYHTNFNQGGDIFSDLVFDLVQNIIQDYPQHLPKLMLEFQPLLTLPSVGRRTVAVAFSCQLLKTDTVVDWTLYDAAVENLLAGLKSSLEPNHEDEAMRQHYFDSQVRIKILCLQGISHFRLSKREEVESGSKFGPLLLTSFMDVIGDDFKSDLNQHALNGLSKLLEANALSVEEVQTVLSELANKVRPFFDCGNHADSTAAIRCFCLLASYAADEYKDIYLDQVQSVLVSLLLHVNDDVEQIQIVSKEGLLAILEVFAAPEGTSEGHLGSLETHLKSYSAATFNYVRFLSDLAQHELFQSHWMNLFPAYIESTTRYFQSSNPNLRASAVCLLATLLGHCQPLILVEIKSDSICQGLAKMLLDKSPHVRTMAATHIGNVVVTLKGGPKRLPFEVRTADTSQIQPIPE
eukprot:TCALIF_00040-PA protein Name:"Similar to CDC45 Cell division control protein 45 homolog (Homo sapiens)" AED:0.07 eAED:0.08 QI:0/0.16/0/0.85/1/1/7/0/2542